MPFHNVNNNYLFYMKYYFRLIGVYGDLKLYGKTHNVVWTKLSTTAEAGSDIIHLKESVDWEVGMQIVVTPTGYNYREVEEHTISEVRNNGHTLVLTEALYYKHLCESETLSIGQTYSTTAEVGLLTRSIKIQGTPSSEYYGGRLLVGVHHLSDNEGFVTIYTGTSKK